MQTAAPLPGADPAAGLFFCSPGHRLPAFCPYLIFCNKILKIFSQSCKKPVDKRFCPAYNDTKSRKGICTMRYTKAFAFADSRSCRAFSGACSQTAGTSFCAPATEKSSCAIITDIAMPAVSFFVMIAIIGILARISLAAVVLLCFVLNVWVVRLLPFRKPKERTLYQRTPA